MTTPKQVVELARYRVYRDPQSTNPCVCTTTLREARAIAMLNAHDRVVDSKTGEIRWSLRP